MDEYHDAGIDPRDLLSLRDIERVAGELGYAALRSYSTHRRTHKHLGPMPAPVTRIANRKLWLRSDIDVWLSPLSVPRWRRRRYSRS